MARNHTEKSLAKLRDLEKSIDGWDGKKITQSCTEFVMGTCVMTAHTAAIKLRS